MAAALLLWCAVAAMAYSDQAWRTLSIFFVWADSRQPFFDLAVLMDGVAYYSIGMDPFVVLGEDARVMYNYPPGWGALRWVGAHLVPINVFGLAMAGAYLALMLVFLRPQARWQAAFAAVLLLSPPVTMLIERGNNEMIVMMLVIVGAWAWNARLRTGGAVAAGCWTLAAVLKLLPIVGIAMLSVTVKHRRLFWLLAAAAASVALMAVVLQDLAQVSSRTPRPHAMAYGSKVILMHLEEYRFPMNELLLVMVSAAPVLALLALAGFAAAGWFGSRPAVPVPASRQLPGVLFLFAGATWLASYMVGANFFYRLAWLLLLVPFWWQRIDLGSERRPAQLGLLLMTVVMFTSVAYGGPVFYMAHLACAALAALVAYELGRYAREARMSEEAMIGADARDTQPLRPLAAAQR